MSNPIIDNEEDLDPEMRETLLDGFAELGQRLRNLRATGDLHSTSAEMMSADGPIRFHCDHEDNVTMTVGGNALDISRLVDER